MCVCVSVSGQCPCDWTFQNRHRVSPPISLTPPVCCARHQTQPPSNTHVWHCVFAELRPPRHRSFAAGISSANDTRRAPGCGGGGQLPTNADGDGGGRQLPSNADDTDAADSAPSEAPSEDSAMIEDLRQQVHSEASPFSLKVCVDFNQTLCCCCL